MLAGIMTECSGLLTKSPCQLEKHPSFEFHVFQSERAA